MASARFVARVEVAGAERVARGLFAKERSAPLPRSAPGAKGDVVLVGPGAGPGETVEVLAVSGTARARLYDLLVTHGLDPVPGDAAMAETARILANPALEDGTADRRDLPFVTIDNEGSRDLDQALCIRRGPRGGYVVYYALADASFYVRPGGALFEHALERGTSYYLPALSVPMLPVELSEGIVSLNPDVDRRALTFVMRLDAEGRVKRTDVVRMRIRSRAKLTYPGVQRWLDEGGEKSEATASLELLREVGERRIALARERGVIDFDRRSLEVELDPIDPRRFRCELRGRNGVERWNEQVSLLCNMEGAALFLGDDAPEEVQPIFRTHAPPPPEALAKLERTLAGLVEQHRLDRAAWMWDRSRGEELNAYLARLPRGEATERVRDGIERQVLYANQPSQFTSGAGPHYALGVSGYARFSSPMREVVGIFTHKEGLERLGVLAPAPDEEDDRTRERAIAAANGAKRRQGRLTKDLHKLVIDDLLEGDLALAEASRPARAGTVLGVDAQRVFVELDGFPVELKVYRADLEAALGTAYSLSADAAALVPRRAEAPSLRVGDGVALRVLGQHQGRWSFRPSVLPRGSA